MKLCLLKCLRLAILSLSTVLIGCEAKPVELRIGIPLWPGYDILYLANELNYFDETRFDVSIIEFSGLGEEVHAYQRGDINVLSLAMVELLLTYDATGRDMKVMLLTDFSHGADQILAKPRITSVKELKGKRVGYERGALPHYFFIQALKYHGLTVDDVVSVAMEYDAAELAVKSDSVDAVVTYPPMSSILISQYGYREIFNSRSTPNNIADMIVADSSLLIEVPDLQEHLFEVWDKTLLYMEQNQEEAYRIIADREGITSSELAEAYQGLLIPNSQEQKALLPPNSDRLLTSLRGGNKMLQEAGMLKQSIDPNVFFDNKK